MRLRRDVSERVLRLGEPDGGLPAGLSAQQFLKDLGGHIAVVADDQPPADDMPALSLLILDALADDAETIYTMRNCGSTRPQGLALVGERHLCRSLRRLLEDGLIEVEEETVAIDARQLVLRRPTQPPPTSDDDLKRYWYVITPGGWEAWRAGHSELNAYYDAHPSQSGY